MPQLWHVLRGRRSEISCFDVLRRYDGNEGRGGSRASNGVSLVRQGFRMFEESESSQPRQDRAARLRLLHRGAAPYAARSQAVPEERLVLREHDGRPTGVGQRQFLRPLDQEAASVRKLQMLLPPVRRRAEQRGADHIRGIESHPDESLRGREKRARHRGTGAEGFGEFAEVAGQLGS